MSKTDYEPIKPDCIRKAVVYNFDYMESKTYEIK